jgi:serine/threonine protein kinase
MHGDTSCDEGSSSSSESEYSGSFIAADGPEDPALGLDLNTQHDFPAFGNSGSLESSRREEQARTLPLPTVFSAPYAAPELFMSRQFDERVDIFSFGLVMWEVFAGVCVCAQPNVACRVVFGMLGCSPQL